MKIVKLVEKVTGNPPSNMPLFMRDFAQYYHRKVNPATMDWRERATIVPVELKRLADKYLGGDDSIVDISNAIASSAEDNPNGGSWHDSRGFKDTNHFLTFIGNFPDHHAFKNNNDKFSYISSLYNQGYADLDPSREVNIFGKSVPNVYYDPTLYAKNYNDFKYIANAFALMSKEKYLDLNFDKSKFTDGGIGDIKNLFFNKRGDVRDASTIEDTIDKWYGEAGKKRNKKASDSPAEEGGNRYSFEDIYKNNKFDAFAKIRDNKDTDASAIVGAMQEYLANLWSTYAVGDKAMLSPESASAVYNSFENIDKIIKKNWKRKLFDSVDDNEAIANSFFNFIL